MTDQDYLDHQSPKHKGPPAGPPQRTATYLETVVAELEKDKAELQAQLEHAHIEIGKLRDQLTVKNFRDAGYGKHPVAHDHEKAKA